MHMVRLGILFKTLADLLLGQTVKNLAQMSTPLVE